MTLKSLPPVILDTLLLIVPLSVVEAQPAEFSYIGTRACGVCHKSERQGQQLKIWQESIHAQAFNVLKTEEASRISRERGLGSRAEKEEACLKCHAVAYNVDKSRRDKFFNVEDGVQCESCHGPGSGYKSLKAMKDPDLARQNGLIIQTDKDAFCRGCHNEESPTFVSFDLETMWAKIEHPIPAN